ncbi:MAG: hypothetical protein COV59_02610 [Candidatus Magasanikbacteria bacterium CG11_big_fil_rev_8_21_14_0_20_39_34]|uniref:Septum formation initiator n=1 Tax=Candidatus Magasanikbacteria bacterium CG11_big_fil_rev_8_21_14_0_20_39_34 TaxID=1974653 RepID=A0A2H0N582_9BACT|nr:MAG: hypothetical protein COV59_02610 [Candidatus Magasanikbacteria bacterium CG11_big_fil_rev_8_21_14_0_20_39_34]
MPKKPYNSGLKAFFTSKLFLLIAIPIAFLVIFGYIRAYYRDYQVRQEIASLEKQISDLKEQKLESLDILDYVMSKNFVEEKARTELNLKKPGEKVAIVDRREAVTQINKQQVAFEDTQDISNIKKWWYYFIHKSLSD